MRLVSMGVIVVLALVALSMAGPSAQAGDKRIVLAQSDNSIFPLFRLFSRDRGRKKAKKTRRARRKTGTRRKRQAVRRRKPAPVIAPKDADASVVLVVGDSLARGTGRGLEVAFADAPKVSIRRWVNGSSGLVRADYFNWPEELRGFLAKDEERVDVVVVMIGVNDRQQLRDDSGRHAFRSQEWEKIYTARVVDLLKALAERRKPVLWVGLPPTRSGKFSADMAHFNDIYKEQTELFGVGFVDIWQFFVDEEGRYTRRGPDVEGQMTTLRAGDGIHFTGSGYRKIAFYVEKELRRVLETGAPALAIGGMAADATLGPRIGVVLPLTGPVARADAPLAGGEPIAISNEDSPQYKVIVRGESLPPLTGRIDDFSWPRR